MSLRQNSAVFYVPAESLNDYKTAEFWSNHANRIQLYNY